MSDETTVGKGGVEPGYEEFAQQIADQVASFLLAVQAIARGEAGGRAVSLLLIEVSQVLLAGARLGMHEDFQPRDEFEPDPGPDPDLDDMRLRLARLLDDVDTYTTVFDVYEAPPQLVVSQMSDELTSVASALAHGLRHFRAGRVDEALWWWQFSYVSTWGIEASGVLRALQSVLTHARLDIDFAVDAEQLAVADEMLERETRGSAS